MRPLYMNNVPNSKLLIVNYSGPGNAFALRAHFSSYAFSHLYPSQTSIPTFGRTRNIFPHAWDLLQAINSPAFKSVPLLQLGHLGLTCLAFAWLGSAVVFVIATCPHTRYRLASEFEQVVERGVRFLAPDSVGYEARGGVTICEE